MRRIAAQWVGRLAGLRLGHDLAPISLEPVVRYRLHDGAVSVLDERLQPVRRLVVDVPPNAKLLAPFGESRLRRLADNIPAPAETGQPYTRGCHMMGSVAIRVVPYDPNWTVRFEQERVLLERLLAPWLSGGIHHIGSTSVPGLAAKPILDMMAGVADLAAARPAIPVL